MTASLRAVDLFCGVGGLTHGLESAGLRVIAGVDIDPACEYPYTRNNDSRFEMRDVASLGGSEVGDWFEGADLTLLAGCTPCQPFSSYSRPGRSQRKNGDWQLVAAFGKLIADIQPDFVTMENVPYVATHRVFEAFLETLSDYNVDWKIVQCMDYGVPQTRSRLVLVASQHGPLRLPSADEKIEIPTVRSMIEDLPAISAGGVDAEDPIHRAPTLSNLNLRRIRASKPGGTWRDWPENLRADCHRRPSGGTFSSVYGRMEWDAPAPTMTTQCFGYGNGRFGHPEQDRAISLREAAMLQTFPRDYEFVPPDGDVKFNRLGRLIGNAVPVRLGEVVGTAILEHVSSLKIA
ncbi:MAG: DNA cytosine methyltransferase [Acidimicrobiaceae bacterium]|nr:DNA cytosine methyltransferase [Acidimicrobiaceae bacterium]